MQNSDYTINYNGPFYGKLTDVNDVGGVFTYTFTEQQWNPVDEQWEDADDARSGTAYEANNLNIYVSSEPIVELTFRSMVEGDETFVFISGGSGGGGSLEINHYDFYTSSFTFPTTIYNAVTAVTRLDVISTLNNADYIASGLYASQYASGHAVVGLFPHGKPISLTNTLNDDQPVYGSTVGNKVTGGAIVTGNQTIHGYKRFANPVQVGVGNVASTNIVIVGGVRPSNNPGADTVLTDQIDQTAYSWNADNLVTYGVVSGGGVAMIGARAKVAVSGGHFYSSSWVEFGVMGSGGEFYLQSEGETTGTFPVAFGPRSCWYAVRDASGTKKQGQTGTILPGAIATGGIVTSLGSGTVPVSAGGTGVTATPTNGQLLIGNGTDYTLNTLTAGTGITITNGSGSITIAATGGGGLTTEDVQDIVGAFMLNTDTTQWTYSDVDNTLKLDIVVSAYGSILTTGGLKLDGDLASPGNNKLYGTNSIGVKGWYDIPTGTSYTDENAQDAIGTILVDSPTIGFTYSDSTPSIVADIFHQMSISADTNGLKLLNDEASPGNSKYYGTNGSGTRGWYSLPGGSGVTWNYVTAPSSSSSTGTHGDYSYDPGWVYFCVGTNSWIRWARDSWPSEV